MCVAGRMWFAVSLLLALLISVFIPFAQASSNPEQANQQPASPNQRIRAVGAIKAINGKMIVLAPDQGPETQVIVQDATSVVRIPLGETNIKNAVPAQLQDLQPGDRILVYGRLAEDSKSLNASTIVVMKRSDVTAKQEQDREDWQKRGLSGLVSAVDAAGGTITIAVPALGGNKDITIRIAKDTIVRRYAPDSVKFEDAKLATLADVKPGDQLRARGARSADGSELQATEVVSGTFRNLAGTVISTDSGAGTVTVLNLATKKPLVVRVTPDSQLHKLPAAMAQRIAMRLQGGAAGSADAAVAKTDAPSPAQPSSGAAAERAHGNGPPDLQQVIARTPSFSLTDLQKGDAVQILSTEGTASGGVTAVMVVAGVEPILQSKGSQGMILSPWSLGGNGGEGESQ